MFRPSEKISFTLSKWFCLSILVFAPCLITIGQTNILRFNPVEIPGASPFLTIDCIFQDSRGFMWFGTYAGLYQYDGYSLTHYSHDPRDSMSLGDNKIRCMHEDHQGNLWIGTQLGLHMFDPKTRIFKNYTDKQYLIGHSVVNRIFQDSSENLWVLAANGLFSIGLNTLEVDNQSINNQFDQIFDLTIDSKGSVWVANGLQLYCKKSSESSFKTIVDENNEIENLGPIVCFLEDMDDGYWLVSEGYVGKFNAKTNRVVLLKKIPELGDAGNPPILGIKYQNELIIAGNQNLMIVDLVTLQHVLQPIDLTDPASNIKNGVSSLYLNNQGQVWVGNTSGFPYVCDLSRSYFRHAPIDLFRDLRGVSSLYELFEYQEDHLLIPGLARPQIFDLSSGKTEEFPFLPSYNTEGWRNVTTFLDEDSLLWIGTTSGLFLLDRVKNAFLEFEHGIMGIQKLRGKVLRDMFRDRNDNLWIATWADGVYRIDFDKKEVESYKFPASAIYSDNNSCRSLFEDKFGHIWIGTRTGLLKYFPERDTFAVYRHDSDDPESMSENTAFCIYEDTAGYIWTGSYGGGLNRLDVSSEKFIHFTISDGLLNNTIFGILPDNHKNIWLLSFDGITRFNPYTYQAQNFTYKNGLGNTGYDGFLYGQSKFSGEIFFGGRQGIDIFHPDSVKLSDFKPPIVLSGFQLFNEPVLVRMDQEGSEDQFLLDQHISWTEEVRLPYDQRVITLEYVALDYSAPENIQYAYQLEGFDADWQFVENKRSATYTNLYPGTYEFKVKATNADGIWNEDHEQILLIITPPWWATHGAYALYAILFGSLLYGIYYYQKRRWELQTALQLQEQESGRLKELDVLKTNLYTNITHEFRTPLTVITGMAELIRKQPKVWVQKGTALIDEHSQQLLSMVNQMLDLQKIEAGKMNLDLIQADIISFINYLAEPFQFIARSKHLDLNIRHQSDVVVLDFDPDKLAMIISNLLSNAIKYTQKGKIILNTQVISDDVFEISIKDTGMGIAEDKLPFIFDRFYQTDQGSTRRGEGSGIGLALVKELLQLMKGEIKVQSRISEGSTFTMQLKITKTAAFRDCMAFLPEKATINYPGQFTITDGIAKERMERILIIEDNADVRRYLRALLVGEFQVMEAIDGVDGIDKSIQLVPDLIISDVMMPGKDGYAVCDTLHQHPLTTHIPVILLTARADTSSRIVGYQRGADVYLTKPFHPEELKAQISMLLEQRKRLQGVYQQELGNGKPQPKNNVRADPFMAELHAMLLSDLSNEELDITRICKSLHVSRSQLHNKIKATTGYSTSIFIRKLRLQEARKLILNSTLHISEIAYQTGFKDPNFFSRVYKQEFGESPKEGRGY